jgi:hypothetical protein
MPNKVPGKLGDPYPAFLPTHATDAFNYIQQALSLTQQVSPAPPHQPVPACQARFVDHLVGIFL